MRIYYFRTEWSVRKFRYFLQMILVQKLDFFKTLFTLILSPF